jgi:hypothetical protein
MPIQAQREGRVIDLSVLNLGSRWSKVIKATLWLICPPPPPPAPTGNRQGPHYRRGWVGSMAGPNGYGQNYLPPPGIKPRTFQPLVRLYTIYVIPTPIKIECLHN